MLVANASGEEFEKLHPELYRSIRQYIAVKNDEAFMWDGAQSRGESKAEDAATAGSIAPSVTADSISVDAAIR